MKKQSAALRKAVARKQKGTASRTVERLDVSIIRFDITGDYKLLLCRGLLVLHSVPLLEYEAGEIARKVGIAIEMRPLPPGTVLKGPIIGGK